MASFPVGSCFARTLSASRRRENQRYGLNKYSAALCTANSQSLFMVREFSLCGKIGELLGAGVAAFKRKAHRSGEMAAKNAKRRKEVRSRGRGATLKNSILLHLCRSSFLRFLRSLRLSRTSSISSACICVICGQFGTEFGPLCLIRGLRSPLVAANGRAGALCASANSAFNFDVNHLNAESAETQRTAEKKNALHSLGANSSNQDGLKT